MSFQSSRTLKYMDPRADYVKTHRNMPYAVIA